MKYDKLKTISKNVNWTNSSQTADPNKALDQLILEIKKCINESEASNNNKKLVTWRIFTTLLSRFGERISTMKSPLLAARRRILTSASRVTRIIVLFANFFFVILFHARETYAASIKRDDVLLFS